MIDVRQQAHHLVDQLPEAQLAALVGLLQSIVAPEEYTVDDAPFDDEPETEEERIAVAEAREWLRQNGGEGIPHEEAMRRLGLR